MSDFGMPRPGLFKLALAALRAMPSQAPSFASPPERYPRIRPRKRPDALGGSRRRAAAKAAKERARRAGINRRRARKGVKRRA